MATLPIASLYYSLRLPLPRRPVPASRSLWHSAAQDSESQKFFRRLRADK